jgi:hypothetical protein
LRPVLPITAVVVAAALGSTAGVATSAGRFRPASHKPPQGPSLAASAAAVQAELAGIPQHGLTLGAASAPVSVVEYADLVSGECARASVALVAPEIASFVRSGVLRIELDPIVESPRSEDFALGAYAAGLQHQGWDYTMLAYARTTAKSYGSTASPQTLVTALGLNPRRWRSVLRRRTWPNKIEQAAKVALLGGFTSYPVFIVRGPGIRRRLQPSRRSVIILRPPVTLAGLTEAIVKAEPGQG